MPPRRSDSNAAPSPKNHANGGEGGDGGSDGEGIGGGVYNLGDFDFDVLTLIFENHASTSHDDVFDLLELRTKRPVGS